MFQWVWINLSGGVSVKLFELAVNIAYCGEGVPGFYVT